MLRVYLPEGRQHKPVQPTIDLENVVVWAALLLFCLLFWTLVWMSMGTQLFVRFMTSLFVCGVLFALACDASRFIRDVRAWRATPSTPELPEGARVIEDVNAIAPAIVIVPKTSNGMIPERQ